jgi:hypothetical protein
VPMLAELIDAVVGVDTHRDTHEVELALPTGTAIGIRKREIRYFSTPSKISCYRLKPTVTSVNVQYESRW